MGFGMLLPRTEAMSYFAGREREKGVGGRTRDYLVVSEIFVQTSKVEKY